jgi:prenyltransferase beta subunit
VHLCCLARSWAAISNQARPESGPPATEMVRRIEAFRALDGGYHSARGCEFGTAYAAFLAVGAYQDLEAEWHDPMRLVQSLKFLETNDGAWANERNVKVGSTNATAAAITTLRNLNVPVNQSAGDWLLARCQPEGGFLAAPGAPIPDLLSTATALHALAGLQVSFAGIKEKCLDFIDTLWTNAGAFHGQWADDPVDCEYTYYGLLALGHLSL